MFVGAVHGGCSRAVPNGAFQPPNPAQTGPGETDLHVRAAQGAFVQPNLHRVMCDFLPCCHTRVISSLCHLKSQKSEGVKAGECMMRTVISVPSTAASILLIPRVIPCSTTEA